MWPFVSGFCHLVLLLKFFLVVICISVSFLSMTEQYCMPVAHFVYPFISCWTSGCFHLLATVTSAAMNNLVHLLFEHVFSSFEYISRSGIAGSHSMLNL